MANSNQPNNSFNSTSHSGNPSIQNPASGSPFGVASPATQSNASFPPPHLPPNPPQPTTQAGEARIPHGRRRALAYREARGNRGRRGDRRPHPVPHASSTQTDIHGFALPNTLSFEAPHMVYARRQAETQANIHGFARSSNHGYPAPHTVTSTTSSSPVIYRSGPSWHGTIGHEQPPGQGRGYGMDSAQSSAQHGYPAPHTVTNMTSSSSGAWGSNDGLSWHGTVDHIQPRGPGYGIGSVHPPYHIQPLARPHLYPGGNTQSNQYTPYSNHGTGHAHFNPPAFHPVTHIQTQYGTNTTLSQPEYDFPIHAAPFIPGNTVHPIFSNNKTAIPPLVAPPPPTLPPAFVPTQARTALSNPTQPSTQVQTPPRSPFLFAPAEPTALALGLSETTVPIPDTRLPGSITPFEASVLRSLHPSFLEEFVEPLAGDREHAGDDHAGGDPWDRSHPPTAYGEDKVAEAEMAGGGEMKDGGEMASGSEDKSWTWNEVGLEREKAIARGEIEKAGC